MSRWSALLSLPSESPDIRLLDSICDAWGRQLAEWLVTVHREEISERSEGLVEFIREWTTQPATLEVVWDPVFGRVQCLLKGHKLDPTEVAARLALQIRKAGISRPWRAHLAAPDTFLLDGIVLPAVKSIAVGAVEGTIMTESDVHIVKYDESSQRWNGQTDATVPWVELNRRIYLLSGSSLPSGGHDEQRFVGVGTTPVAEVTDDMIRDFGLGIERVGLHYPDYASWVDRVLRNIVVCPIETGFRVVSGSGEDATGVIHASYPVSPIEIAEILVHECTHQYFYMAQWVSPVDDGSDPELYWSPPIRMKRPLSRILMAYHALANILVFYDAVKTGDGLDVDYVIANEPAIRDAVAELDKPLRGNEALTDAGRGLYEPLAERLATMKK